MGARLEVAYQQFRRWRWENKETCKITEFALRTFKIQTSLLLLSMRFLNTNLYIEIKICYIYAASNANCFFSPSGTPATMA